MIAPVRQQLDPITSPEVEQAKSELHLFIQI